MFDSGASYAILKSMNANKLHPLFPDPSVRLAALKAQAAEQMAAFPQYAGRFEAMKLAIAKVTVVTKLGTAMAEGDLLLVDDEARAWRGATNGPRYATIWSFRNQCLTSIAARDLEMVNPCQE